MLASILQFLSFPYKLPTQGFWTLNTRRNYLKQNDTIIFRFRTPAFHFHFHNCKHENLGLEVMLIALKSSLDFYRSFCLCGHNSFTSNSLLVMHLSKHQNSTHFEFDHFQYGFDLAMVI